MPSNELLLYSIFIECICAVNLMHYYLMTFSVQLYVKSSIKAQRGNWYLFLSILWWWISV